MTTFTRTWNDSYEALPPNSEDARKGASRIRDMKLDIEERMAVDHSWIGDDKDGAHLRVTLYPRDVDPATIPAGTVYAKAVGTAPNTSIELFYKNDKGSVTQMTSGASAGATVVLPGTILPIGNSGSADMSPAYLHCNGQAVNRVTYAALFYAIATLWGGGDGINTFNVPDLRGRTLIGAGQGTGLTNRSTAQFVGTEGHQLTIAEMPAHDHATSVQTGAGTPGAVAYQGANASNATGTMQATGNNNAHPNMQPSAVVHWVIKT